MIASVTTNQPITTILGRAFSARPNQHACHFCRPARRPRQDPCEWTPRLGFGEADRRDCTFKLTNPDRARGADQAITGVIDAFIEADRADGDDDDGPASALVLVG
jgi:hypothetical protein